jgi:general stress protein 26
MNRDGLYDFIRAYRYAVMASVSGDGAPEAAVIGIAVTPDLEIVFDTTDATRKCPNLRRNARIALVIGGWDKQQTVQYEGVADEPEGAERERLLKTYFEAFPDGPARSEWPGITYFRVRPRWVRYSSYYRPRAIEAFRFD